MRNNRSLKFIPRAMCLVFCFHAAVSAEDFQVYPSDATLDELYKLRGGSPEEYRQAREALRQYDKAEDYIAEKKALRSTQILKSDSLQITHEVKVTKGYLTTLTFQDIAGNPYPVQSSRIGNKERFSVTVGDAAPGQTDVTNISVAHIVTIETPASTGRSNLKLIFDGIKRPVNVRLVVDEKSYHDDLVVTIPILSPQSRSQKQADVAAGLSYAAAPSLIEDNYARALADGVNISTLKDALAMSVKLMSMDERMIPTQETAAVRVGNTVYLKAKLREVNPAPSGISRALNGYSVFKFKNLPRLITGQDKNGTTVLVRISDSSNRYGLRELPNDGGVR